MVIALFGKHIEPNHKGSIELLLAELSKRNMEVIVYAPFFEFLEVLLGYKPSAKALFRSSGEVKHLANFMLSIGGDGTFLESATYIEDSCIPVVGINFGRLGFLAHISSEEIPKAVEELFRGDFTVENRTALEINMANNPFGDFKHGLNEVTIQKKNTSMVTIDAYIDNEFLCTYWADGLIVSTPTGSTAYSLSVGGPIVSPNSSALVISPIAPHHLTVRPLVIPDSSILKFYASTRDKEIIISLDSRSAAVRGSLELTVKKAAFCVGLVRLKDTGYYKTLRNKLMWGLDTRNSSE